jgi:hypothetical protein
LWQVSVFRREASLVVTDTHDLFTREMKREEAEGGEMVVVSAVIFRAGAQRRLTQGIITPSAVH